MSIQAWAGLLVALAGVISAVTALIKQWQAGRQLRQHVQAHGKDAHPAPDKAAAE